MGLTDDNSDCGVLSMAELTGEIQYQAARQWLAFCRRALHPTTMHMGDTLIQAIRSVHSDNTQGATKWMDGLDHEEHSVQAAQQSLGFVGTNLDCGVCCAAELTGETRHEAAQRWLMFCRRALEHETVHMNDTLVQAWGALQRIVEGKRGPLKTAVKTALRKVRHKLSQRQIVMLPPQYMQMGDAMTMLEYYVEERVVPISSPMLITMVHYALCHQGRWATLKVWVHPQSHPGNAIVTQVGRAFRTTQTSNGRPQEAPNDHDGTLAAILTAEQHWLTAMMPDTGYESDDARDVRQNVPVTDGPASLRRRIGFAPGVVFDEVQIGLMSRRVEAQLACCEAQLMCPLQAVGAVVDMDLQEM